MPPHAFAQDTDHHHRGHDDDHEHPHGGDHREGDGALETPLRRGTWALQFAVAPEFNLTSFQGSAFSGKVHLGPGSAPCASA